MAGNGGADTQKADETLAEGQKPQVTPDKSIVENTQGIRTDTHEKANDSLSNPSLSKFPYTVDDVPKGQAGLDWLIEHREEVYPWVGNQLMFDNGGSPPATRFYYDAVQQYQDKRMLGYKKLGEKLEGRKQEARKEAAKLLHCKSKEIAFIQNTAQGINVVAQGLEGLDWKTGDEIILCRGNKEYPSNYVPWRQLKVKLARRGVKIELKEVGDENGFISPEEMAKQVTDKTKFVTLSSVGWKSGQRINLEEIGKIVKSKGALFHVDAIQTLGAYDLDVKKCNIDFLSASAHKWLLADQGNGIFYCKKAAIEYLRKDAPQGAESLKDWQNPNSGLKRDATVFETGAVSNQGIQGLSQSLKLINKVGITNIERKILELSDYLRGQECRKKLEAKGYTIFGTKNEKEKSGMVFITRPEWEAKKGKNKVREQINEMIYGNPGCFKQGKDADENKKPIYMSIRDGRLRAAIHYYNTKEEIDEMINRLPDLGKAA